MLLYLILFTIICVLYRACIFLIKFAFYITSTYYNVTHNSYLSVLFDKGLYGEYLIYKGLKKQEKNGARFLFNAYLPKKNGETTEVDVILINPNGIFIFESKNYSGWIFGSENQKTWTQCLPRGRRRFAQKEHFLNPIFQNKLHISAIKNIIGDEYPIYSVIAFSKRCVLKDVTVTNPMVCVVNRNDASFAVDDYFPL